MDAATTMPDATPPAMPGCVPTPPELIAACVASCEHLRVCQLSAVESCATQCASVGEPYRDDPSCLELHRQFHACVPTLACDTIRTSGFAGACASLSDMVQIRCPAPRPEDPLPC
jgi:hypothetical protein